MTAQIGTALVGAWLIVSAFLWRHSSFHFQNTIAGGLLALALAVAAGRRHQVMSLGGLLAMWLFLSTLFVEPARAATLWNNALAAVAIWALSLLGCAALPSNGAHRRGVT